MAQIQKLPRAYLVRHSPNMLLSLVYTTLFTSFVCAQQYAGRPVAVPELPSVAGAELAYFNIKDNTGGNVTLLNYFSFPNGKRQDTTQVVFYHERHWARTNARTDNRYNGPCFIFTEPTVAPMAISPRCVTVCGIHLQIF